MAKSLGYLRRLLPMPDDWTTEDERVHAGCEYADERTMPPLPKLDDADRLGRWANDLSATHDKGDIARMVFTLLSTSGRLVHERRHKGPGEGLCLELLIDAAAAIEGLETRAFYAEQRVEELLRGAGASGEVPVR